MESRNLGSKRKIIKLMSNVGNYGLIILTERDQLVMKNNGNQSISTINYEEESYVNFMILKS